MKRFGTYFPLSLQAFLRTGMLCLLAFWFAPVARAQSSELPISIQVKILAKILSYDHNLASRMDSKGNIVVGVIYQEKNWESRNEKMEIAALAGTPLTVNGHPIIFKFYAVGEKLDGPVLPGRSEVSIYFITALRGVNLTPMLERAEIEKIMTYSTQPSLVSRGIAVSVEQKGQGSGIVVNHKVSQREGCNFSSQLLKIARLIN